MPVKRVRNARNNANKVPWGSLIRLRKPVAPWPPTLLPLFFLFFSFMAGCVVPPEPKEEAVEPTESLIKLKEEDLPRFSDGLDKESLTQAIAKSLHYYKKLPKDRLFHFGKDEVRTKEMIVSLEKFSKLIQKEKSPKKLNRMLHSHFDVYQPPPIGRKKEEVLFTGYYEPSLDASRERTSTYRYPLYRKPKDLLTLDLGIFHPSFEGKRLVGLIGKGTLLPYFTREEIDSKGVLTKLDLELAWLADPVEAFFLHIQGSGKLRLRDGSMMNVNYAAKNGRAYRSIGKFMIREGIVPKEKASMESIKDFLRKHPEERQQIFNHNESYIFFREVPEGPIGSISEPLTAGRSIATDNLLFPKGALAYIETQIPRVDSAGHFKGWKKISRFVMNQDTGSAIKGTGRVDLFFGSGDKAGQRAGFLKKKGRLYFLTLKPK